MTTDNLVNNSSSNTTTKTSNGLVKPDSSSKSVNFTVTATHQQSNGTTKKSHYNTSFNKTNSSNSRNKKV